MREKTEQNKERILAEISQEKYNERTEIRTTGYVSGRTFKKIKKLQRELNSLQQQP